MTSLSAMRCVVLGAGGFIGTNLCRQLRGRVEYLRACGRRQSFPTALEGVDWYAADFNKPASIPTAIAGCDTVFHLINASTPASANVDKVADIQENLVSTLHLLDACREMGVKRIIFASSGGTIYGVPSQLPTPETAETSPITAYGISKLAIEKYLFLYEHLYGIDYRVLRLSNPYGPYQTAAKSQGVIAAFLSRALLGESLEVWGDGSVTRDYVYIDDVIEGFIAAATHTGSSRVFNIGSGDGRSLVDVIHAIETVLTIPVTVNWKPGRNVDIPISVMDVELANLELKWRPRTSFERGLATTAEWLANDVVKPKR